MRRLEKVKPSGRGLAYVLPDGPWYYPLTSTYIPHYDDFPGTALTEAGETGADWVGSTTLGGNGSGGAALSVASSFVTLATGTGTAGTATVQLRSAHSSNANVYTIPFRAMFVARTSITGGAGVSCSGLHSYLGIRDTAETQIAQFHFDLTTAGSSSLASPVVNVEVRQGSTASGFISSAAHNIFNATGSTGLPRTATDVMGYVIEATHRGIWFGIKQDLSSVEPIMNLSFFERPLRMDKNYFLDARIVADGTAGYTQSASVKLEIDAVQVEQFAPQAPVGFETPGVREGSVRSFLVSGIKTVSAAGALATTGAGVFLGFGFTSTASAGADVFFAAYDASANSTGVYDFGANHSSVARLIWGQQVSAANSGAADTATPPMVFPPNGIPFFRGLVVAFTTAAFTGDGATTYNAVVVYRGQQ